jgi:hypothetical protein
MSELKFRNIDVTPDDPVDTWGIEGILAAIDRGSLRHWHRVVDAVRNDPGGEVEKDLRQALELASDRGVVAWMRRALDRMGER